MRLGVAGEEEEEVVELRRADMEMEGRNVDLVWAGEREVRHQPFIVAVDIGVDTTLWSWVALYYL